MLCKADRGIVPDKPGQTGTRNVRTDSDGTINGVLLRQGLVDEMSMLLHPAIVGGPRRIRSSVIHSSRKTRIPSDWD